MTRFEEIGVERQHKACNKYQAIKSFENSCYACCVRNMQIDCERCSISYVHHDVMKAFLENSKLEKSYI